MSFEQVIQQLRTVEPSALRFTRGIEKEGLRVNADAQINQSKHPFALGSTLTHPSITTDYSEALLEFITPVSDNSDDVLSFLDEVQRYAFDKLGNQYIWPASMPGVIHDELDVPIAEYGESNIGILKHVYRHGLWHRYGRKMQCIAGMHYNFSVSQDLWKAIADQQGVELNQDFISQGYFGLIRNFRRYSWLLLYLFGASPAVDASFLDSDDHGLDKWDEQTYYGPYATSLRMSGLGYQNNAQDDLFVCFNGLPTYTETLKDAMHQSMPQYESIGIEEGGLYKQLNTNLLQIENEYYSDIRPKRNSQSGEKPLTSLNKYGVEYIEVRCLDLNPFEPLGANKKQIDFLDVFLAYCLLSPSAKLSDQECADVSENSKRIVLDGRNPEFRLKHNGECVSVQQWGTELISQLRMIAEMFDEKHKTTQYVQAIERMQERIDDVSKTPSAQVLEQMKSRGCSFSQFGLEQSKQVAQYFSTQLSDEKIEKWDALAKESLLQQSQLEANNQVPFSQFLEEYLKKE